MRHSNVSSTPPSEHLFVGAKCAKPVPLATSIHLDILIQASLDPAVSKIEYVPMTEIAGRPVWLNAVVINRNGRRFAIELPESRPLRDIDSEGLLLLAFRTLDVECLPIFASDVRREPAFSNARAIWSHRSFTVSPELRENILAAVDGDGITLHRLAERFASDVTTISAICSLACEGALTINLSSAPLNGESVVRNMTAAPLPLA